MLNNTLTNMFNFINNNNFYTGICLFEECDDFLNNLFNNNTYSDGMKVLSIRE